MGKRRDTSRGAGRLAPPEWLLAGLRPKPARIPWAAAARASVALAAPLAAGIAAGAPQAGVLVSVGAMFGVISDTADAYRMRLITIAVPQLFGAVGITLGALVYGHGWVAVGILTLVALVSGMISSIGAVASSSGLLLLLTAALGAGLPLPGPWWKPPLLFAVGGLFVLVLSLLAWPLRGRAKERAAVAGTYRALADLLEAAGGTEYDGRRLALTQSLNDAYDVVLARRARDHGRRGPLVRLVAQLNVIIPLVESAPAAHLHGGPLPAAFPAAVRELADAVAEGSTGGPALELPAPRTPAEHAVEAALRHVAAVVRTGGPDPHDVGDRLGRPAPLWVRVRNAARDTALSRASWRYGLRLALCVGIAQALVSLIAVERSYWITLTVIFVLKPDFGSVFSRAVLRALGTAAGLVVAAAVLTGVPPGWWDVPVMMLLAPLVPAISAKGYAFQTAALTPVILLLTDILNHQGPELILPRLVDSVIGCAIVLVAGYLLWPESWHTRIGDRLADAVEDAAEYVRSTFGTAGEGDRVRRRRRLYRDLSAVRAEFQRALTEPPPTGARAAAWWPLVIAVERVADATTAARVRVGQGAPPPAPAETADIERRLRELAAALRSSDVLVGAREEPAGEENGVLGPLRQEVRAARAIASPQRRSGLRDPTL
ncbi:FUSC family protein [Streptomyces sp. NPDC006923]|uniref:FUSC family protein n=1 Tax=Streptomyces sp. NPDC006923 TaxID=3155355 RepID=UPI0033D86CC6